MWSRANQIKLTAASLFTSMVILIPIGEYHRNSALPRDPFWKYQSVILAGKIKSGSTISELTFAPPGTSPMEAYTGNFVNQVSSVVNVLMASEVLGTSFISVLSSPLFTIQLVLGAALLSYTLTPRREIPLIASLIAVSMFYRRFVVVSFSHRVVLAWALLFFLLSICVMSARVRRSQRSKARAPLFMAAFILTIATVLAYRTLAVAIVPFFLSLYLLGYIGSNKIMSRGVLLTFVSAVLISNILLYPWAVTTIAAGITRFAYLGEISFNSIIRSGSEVHPSLLPYTELEYRPQAAYVWLTRGMASVAVILLITSICLRSVPYKNTITDIFNRNRIHLNTYDIFLVSLGIQFIFLVLALPLFTTSGGSDPLLYGILFSPVFGSRAISTIWRKIRRVNFEMKIAPHIFIGFTVILILSVPFAAAMMEPTSPHGEFRSVSDYDRAQGQWAADNSIKEPVIGDFYTLSIFKTLGGGNVYYPPPGQSYSTNDSASRLIDIYYQNPADSHRYGSTYLASDNMNNHGMYHRTILTTKPNPMLSSQLEDSNRWNSVYSNGKSTTHVARKSDK